MFTILDIGLTSIRQPLVCTTSCQWSPTKKEVPFESMVCFPLSFISPIRIFISLSLLFLLIFHSFPSASDYNAFVHRDSVFDIFVDSFWEQDPNNELEEKAKKKAEMAS